MTYLGMYGWRSSERVVIRRADNDQDFASVFLRRGSIRKRHSNVIVELGGRAVAEDVR